MAEVSIAVKPDFPPRGHAVFSFLGGLVVLMLAGCSGAGYRAGDPAPYASIVTTYDPRAAFPDVGTFSWMPGCPPAPDFPSFKKIPLDERIRSSLAKALTRKGYRLAGPGGSSFWVAYRVALEGDLNDSAVSSLYGPGSGWSPGAQDAKVYTRGSLIVDIVNPATRRPEWRGSYQARIVPEAPEGERQKRLDQAAERLFSRFPPRAHPGTQ